MKVLLLALVACSAPARRIAPLLAPPAVKPVAATPEINGSYEQLRRSHDPEPRRRAVLLMAKACDHDKDPVACGLLGDELTSGVFIDRDVPRAARVRDVACSGKQADACYALGRQDKKYYALGCELGHAWSCYFADRQQKAFDMLEAACEGGDDVACADAIRMYRTTPLAADENALWQQLREALDDGCTRGDGAVCTRYAGELEIGFDNGPQDRVKAQQIRERACELDDPDGCEAAALYLTTSDQDKNRAFTEKACKLGVAAACGYLGYLLYRKDPPRAHAAYQRACDLGDVDGCDKTSVDEKDPARIHALTLRSCNLGSAYACVSLGEDEEKAFHYDEAADFFARACDSETQLICDGCGGELRVSKVQCDAGDADGCTRAEVRKRALPRQAREIAEYACCGHDMKVPANATSALLMFRDALRSSNVATLASLVDPKHGLSVRAGWHGPDGAGEQTKKMRANAVDLSELDGLMSFGRDRLDCADPEGTEVRCRAFEGGFYATYTVTIYGGRPYVTSIDEESH